MMISLARPQRVNPAPAAGVLDVAAAKCAEAWQWGAIVVIVLAGLLKLADLPAFGAAVKSWAIVPPPLVPLVVILVPLAEIALFAAWPIGRWRIGAEVGAVLLLLLFSVIYALQLLISGAPMCGCRGVLARHYKELDTAWFVLGKNTVLITVLVGDLACGFRAGSLAKVPHRHGQEGTAQPMRAFTLIETLMVIFAIGILMALGSPILARARDTARGAATLSNLRSHASIIAAYHNDYADQYPALTDPRATYSIIRCESAGIAVPALYFEAYNLWNIGLADQYYGGQWSGKAFQSAWDPPGPFTITDLHMACSFQADPAYYAPETRMLPPDQLRAVRSGEVQFPSHKALMVAYTPWVRFQRIFAGMVDGHAAEYKSADAGLQMPSADGRYYQYGYHDLAYTPMTHTLHGVRGRDVR